MPLRENTSEESVRRAAVGRDVDVDEVRDRDAMLVPLREACRRVALAAGPIIVGVSGGGDSVGLVHAFRHGGVLPPPGDGCRVPIIVAHAEHDLREDAGRDRDFTAALAARLGFRFVTRLIPCRAAAAGSGEGLEAAARRLRYEFLVEAARDAGARAVVVAHCADDQVETILHALLRGTGLAGLGGMPEARELADGISLMRPMLGIERSVVRRYLEAAGETWLEDPTNADRRFARNFLRHVILPAAESGPYPAASASLLRLGRQAAGISAAIVSAAELLLEEHSGREGDGTTVIRPGMLRRLDRQMLGEIFVAVWKREGWPRRAMTARHYHRLAAMLAEGNGACDLPGGVRATVAGDGSMRLRRDRSMP